MSLTGGPRLSTVPFKNLNSFNFDGVDDYIDCGDNDNLSFGDSVTDSPFSISTWVNMTDATKFRIVTKAVGGTSNTNEYALFLSGTDQLFLQLYDLTVNDKRNRYYTTPLTSYEGQWIHIVATYSGVGGNNAQNGIKLYLNGNRVDNASGAGGNYTAMHNTTAPLEIAKLTTSYSNGLIDELAIFNTELSANDVTTIYNDGIPNNLNDLSTPPLSWWRMGDNAIWNGQTWIIPNSGTDTQIVRSINMLEANRTTDVPPNPFRNLQSIALDGIDDYVDCGDADNLSFGDSVTDSPFSFSMWVKVDTLVSGHGLIEKQDSSNNREYVIYIASDGAIYNNIYSNGVALNRRGRKTNTGLISIDTWYHIVWTYNGNSDYSGIKIYLDGVRVDNANNGKNTYVAMKNTSNPFKIGEFITGNMDEVSVFNSELSQSDITTIYNSGVPNDLSSLNPLSWWRCGDGDTAPTLTDNGSGGNNGTMTNFSTFSTDVPTFSKKSILLDGVDDYVDVSSFSPFLGSKSASMWLKFTDSGATRYAMNLGSDNWGFYSDSGKIAFFSKNTSGSFKSIIATTTTNDGQWHNYIGVNDGTNLKLYIDGVLDNSNTDGSNGTTVNAASKIGSRWNGANNFSGSIDEVAIFDTDQSSNAFTIGGTIPTDLTSYNPLGWWRCGDGDTSPTLTDNGSGGNDGTMTNFTTFSTDVPN